MLKFSDTFKIIILALLLLVLLFISSFLNILKSKSEKISENYLSNPNYTELNDKYIEGLKDSIVYKKEIYHIDFLRDSFEKKLVFMVKNAAKWTLKRKLNVHVFTKENDSYKSMPKNKDYIDLTPTTKPVMRTDAVNNYSVLEVNLPFIDIDSIEVFYKNAWKSTFKKPFKNEIEIADSYSIKPTNKDLYLPILHQLLLEHNISFLPLKKDSLFACISKSNYIISEHASLMIIKDKSKFWNLISKRDTTFFKEIKFKGDHKGEGLRLLKAYTANTQNFSETFDIKKLADYFSILNLFGADDNKEIILSYNQSRHIFEPFFTANEKIGTINVYLKDPSLKESEFINSYLKSLHKIKELSILNLLKKTPDLSKKIKILNKLNPSLLFKSSILNHNLQIIQKDVNPVIFQKTEFLKMIDNHLSVSIENFSVFPVEIKGLYYNKKKYISNANEKNIIAPKTKDTITFDLPRSFENLFTHKKKKITGFVFAKDIEKLFIKSRVIQSNKSDFVNIIPYQAEEAYHKENDLFRKEIELSEFPFIKIDSIKRNIVLNRSFNLDKPLVFPANYTIIAKKGISINILDGGKIISHSPFRFIGTEQDTIHIISKDKRGQGILVLAENKESVLKYVSFENLTNPDHGNWSSTSAVTFYESPVQIGNCIFKSNYCEDALNIVRTNFSMINTSFFDIQSDAFDGDFVKGNLNYCSFSDIGNDAIDISGSQLNISNINIKTVGDKGISVGENSQLNANHIQINNAEIAVAGKDLSTVTIDDIDVAYTKLAFTAFQKKPEFGASNIEVTNIKMNKVETNYLIENTSSLIIDGKIIKTKNADVKSRMYGVDFGVSSKETKKRKN